MLTAMGQTYERDPMVETTPTSDSFRGDADEADGQRHDLSARDFEPIELSVNVPVAVLGAGEIDGRDAPA